MAAFGGLARRIGSTADFESGGLLVFEPTAGVQLGVTEFLRVAAGVSYRLAVCLACPSGLDTGRTSGPSGVAELRFGQF